MTGVLCFLNIESSVNQDFKTRNRCICDQKKEISRFRFHVIWAHLCNCKKIEAADYDKYCLVHNQVWHSASAQTVIHMILSILWVYRLWPSLIGWLSARMRWSSQIQLLLHMVIHWANITMSPDWKQVRKIVSIVVADPVE